MNFVCVCLCACVLCSSFYVLGRGMTQGIQRHGETAVLQFLDCFFKLQKILYMLGIPLGEAIQSNQNGN